MTETNFDKFKAELADIRAYSETTGVCVLIDVNFKLRNGELITVRSSRIPAADTETTKVEWEKSSPKLENGVIIAYDYPEETNDDPNATTRITMGHKKEYLIPLEEVSYIYVNWVDRKTITVPNTSTANVATATEA